MAKRCIVVQPDDMTTLVGSCSTNWQLCVICQQSTKEKLQCPANSKRSDCGAGYISLSNILSSNILPNMQPLVSRLDEGEGILNALTSHCAKWHKSCRSFFCQREVDRESKRSTPEDVEDVSEHVDTIDSPLKRRNTRSMCGTTTDEGNSSVQTCFLCDGPAEASNKLHAVQTLDKVQDNVEECARKLNNFLLLAYVTERDLVSKEAHYHAWCLRDLYNKARAVDRRDDKMSVVDDNLDDAEVNGLVLAQLISYIEDVRTNTTISPVFKLSDLVKLYSDRLSQMGILSDAAHRPHSTRLKQRILSHFPDMRAQEQGRDIILVFDIDIGPALLKACRNDSDQDALCLSRAANIVRKHMFVSTHQFEGSFPQNCQVNAVPKSLLALVSMILEGPSITAQSLMPQVPAATEIAQLLVFNSVKKVRCLSMQATGQTAVRHNKQCETPLPLYIGLLLHAETRKKSLINKFAERGLSVSYDRILSITSNLATEACTKYHQQQAVYPSILQSGVFTVAAVDNIDHNPSSTTATAALHGTAISLQQPANLPFKSFIQTNLRENGNNSRLATLPLSYTVIPPVSVSGKSPIIPECMGEVRGSCQCLTSALISETCWLNAVKIAANMGEEVRSPNNWISWSAYHAHNAVNTIPACTTLMGMLPLFRESSNSIAMIRHSMDIIKTAVSHLNADQTPVITFDQPLYTLAKTIQWNWPSIYGEDKFVIMLGGLHTEMAALKAVGSFLKGSGWVETLSDAGVTTPGTAESFLTASHVRRTRHMHEVTAAGLHILQHTAYESYVQISTDEQNVLSFDKWCEEQAAKQPQFAYWSLVKQFELDILIFVRSIRTSNFKLYVDSLTKLIPWFFTFDRTHYARWLPIHVRDMMSLSGKHNDVLQQFLLGNFTAKKSLRAFSAMSFDQAHEQLNAAIKGDGGAIGLTENEQTLARFMITSPEIARLIDEFENDSYSGVTDSKHHEQTASAQRTFISQLNDFVVTVKNMGNPFEDDSGQLSTLHSKEVVVLEVASKVANILEIGKLQYDAFVSDRLINRTVNISEPLKRNNVLPFDHKVSRTAPKLKSKMLSLKNDLVLFSRLYIACQTRNGSLDEFFKHENQSSPPSLSSNGELNFCTKSDLLERFDKLVAPTDHIVLDGCAVIIDGAAIVQMLKPGSVTTFAEYAELAFLPFLRTQLSHASRLDVVWDRYDINSLKNSTRSLRGVGVRRRVTPSTPLPKNWQSFMCDSANKTELFQFLSECVSKMTIDSGKQIIVTNGVEVITVPPMLHDLSPCSHEEADTRMILHAKNAVQNGFSRVVIKTVDTDVVVLAVSFVHRIAVDELWIAFGTGKHFRYIPAHKIAALLGKDKCTALPVFHAVTGCDTTSSFVGKGKKSAWDTWDAFPDVTCAFNQLASTPAIIPCTCLEVIERFVILLYDKTSTVMSVNVARKQLFSKKGRPVNHIPPTQDSLIQHLKRASYQAGHVWGQSIKSSPTLPTPSDWGWQLIDGLWQPLWITIPEAAKCCPELLSCGCKAGCATRRCKCRRADLECTSLCACNGECTRDMDEMNTGDD